MAFLRIPLVGSLINRNANPSSFSTKDQLFVNCYPEIVKNPVTGATRVFLYKRVGFTAASPSNTLIASIGRIVWTGKADGSSPILLSFIKSGGTNIQIYSGTSQIGGDIATTNVCQALTETMVSTVSNLVGIFMDSVAGGYEGWFFPEGGAWTFINDGDFPPNLGTPEPLCINTPPVPLDGYLFWGTTNGKIWNSDLNSVSAYTANSYITDQSYPDGLVGIARYKNLVVAFGKFSTSFYQNTGNATGSPLTLVASATTRTGAIPYSGNGQTIAQIGETVYWVGIDSETGSVGIYRLNGYSPEKVSTPFIDKLLNSVGTPWGVSGGFSMHGMKHILFYAGSSTIAYCYCVDTGFWWEWGTTASFTPFAIAGTQNTVKFGSSGDGKVYTAANSTFTDDGNAYTQTVQTELLDMGTMSKKVITRVRVVGDIQSSASAVTVSYSDDDYATFTTLGTIDMSDAAAVANGLTRAGTTRRRSWKLAHSAGTPLRLEALELEYSVEAGT